MNFLFLIPNAYQKTKGGRGVALKKFLQNVKNQIS